MWSSSFRICWTITRKTSFTLQDTRTQLNLVNQLAVHEVRSAGVYCCCCYCCCDPLRGRAFLAVQIVVLWVHRLAASQRCVWQLSKERLRRWKTKLTTFVYIKYYREGKNWLSRDAYIYVFVTGTYLLVNTEIDIKLLVHVCRQPCRKQIMNNSFRQSTSNISKGYR